MLTQYLFDREAVPPAAAPAPATTGCRCSTGSIYSRPVLMETSSSSALRSFSCAWHALVPQNGHRECSGPPNLRFRIEPACPARQTLRRSLLYGSRLRSACFTRRHSAQCSLCHIVREDTVNFTRLFLGFAASYDDKIWCYLTLLAFVLSSVPLSHISMLYFGRESAP